MPGRTRHGTDIAACIRIDRRQALRQDCGETPGLAEQQQLNVAPLVNGTPAAHCALNAGDLVVTFQKAFG